MLSSILILGPTASGKSSLAVKIAKKINAEIINMDSMQVYKDLPILSATPNTEEREGVTHHLFGYIDAAQAFSTGEYIKAAKNKIDEINIRNKTAILVGGTGLYAHALTCGMVETPPVSPEIRSQVRKLVEADRRGQYNRLKKIDPIAHNRIEANDSVRIARALEVFDATGKSLSEWHKDEQPPIIKPENWRGFGLMPPREFVYENIEKRFRQMVTNGGLEEVENLWKRNLPDDLPAMKALGIPNLIEYFEGLVRLDDAISRAITQTRQYAKRQYTWLNNRASEWPKFENAQDLFAQF
ncbi:MAG: tRNA (adenosine(37)-N6)-dimethylallyltransferase MiaA [Caulobacterales bacterium]|nr:tRNA (adenosine(37)-N6)-dimethylallyltransferase MiaA [Caulobacterales bacterium]